MTVGGDMRLAAIAGQLVVSPRTLQRQLQAEDTSYRAVLGDTREKPARRYLADRSLTTSQVACLLAYDDTNSCHRAFRRWTGLTPEAARAGGATSWNFRRRAAFQRVQVPSVDGRWKADAASATRPARSCHGRGATTGTPTARACAASHRP
ncbi:helix-turn-helix domain-containing protein [Streptomyces misionensis]|uniref:Helix-turn-helix domain-containing protein n=1 Tax=Streptomyces misionensis TaxID=67331 RepID=A0A5C6JWE6_9ACTN|nr:helix-turn-helix domain-containing protein [Streptomyces misionensis]